MLSFSGSSILLKVVVPGEQRVNLVILLLHGLTAQYQADTIEIEYSMSVLIMDFGHNLETVRALHQAYADKVQSFFSGLKQVPRDPYQVQIKGYF